MKTKFKESKNKLIALSLLGAVSTSTLSFAAERGVDSGGGNAIPAPEAGVTFDQLSGSLRRAEILLAGWLKRQNVSYKLFYSLFKKGGNFPTAEQQPSDLDEAIHGGANEIISRLRQYIGRASEDGPSRIDIRKDAPCEEDAEHQDGSFNRKSAKPICISFLSLSKKLTVDDMYFQLFALLAHELAHAAGLNEDAAKKFQQIAKKAYTDEFNASAYQYLRSATIGGVANSSWSINDIPTVGLCVEFEDGSFKPTEFPVPYGDSILHGNLELYSSRYPISVFDGAQIAQFIEANIRAKNVYEYSCSVSKDVKEEHRENFVKIYQNKFGQNPELNALSVFLKDELLQGIWPQTTAHYFPRSEYYLAGVIGKGTVIKKITTDQEALEELSQLRKIFSSLDDVVNDFHKHVF